MYMSLCMHHVSLDLMRCPFLMMHMNSGRGPEGARTEIDGGIEAPGTAFGCGGGSFCSKGTAACMHTAFVAAPVVSAPHSSIVITADA